MMTEFLFLDYSVTERLRNNRKGLTLVLIWRPLLANTYQNLLQKVLSAAQTLKVNGFPDQTLVVMTAQAKRDSLLIRQVN